MRFLKKGYFWYFVGILVACLVVLWPLAHSGFILTDDGDWMVIRLSAFFQSLREGQFPVRFLGRLNDGYGYPVSNFLYPGFLYLGSFIHIFGISFPDTVKVIFGGSVIGAAFLIFLWLRRSFSIKSSFIGTLNFVFAPYLLFDIYKRGSVGEVLALGPAILAFYSIDSKKYWLLPWAVGFLIVSHNSLALMLLVLIFFYILIKSKLFLFLPLLLGTGLAAFFWFPAQYELKYVIFGTVTVSEPAGFFVRGGQLMLLGFAGIAAGCLLTLHRIKLRQRSRTFFLTFFTLAIVLATSLSSFVWKNSFFANLFQFPFRFLAIVLISGSWIVADALDIFTRQAAKLVILFVIFWIIALPPLFSGIKSVEHETGFYTTNEATTTVRKEYMPTWVIDMPRAHVGERVVFYRGRGNLNVTKDSAQNVIADIDAFEESTIQINLIYYPGWGVTVDDQLMKIDYTNPQGVIRFQVPKGKHHIVAEFRETVPRFAADLVSVVFVGLALIYSFLAWKGNKRLLA